MEGCLIKRRNKRNNMFKTAYHHIRRSPYQAFAAILIMMVTFFSISVFTFLIAGSAKVITYFESIPRVTAFFNIDAKQSDIDALKSKLLATGKIDKITFVSKEEALTKFKQMTKSDNPLLQDLVTEDILPSSFEIATKKLEDLPTISDSLKNSPIVYKVGFYTDVVPKLLSWTHAIREVGFALIIILSIISVLIMTIIIGLKVAQKREEIEIMRLIGATKLYISGPFILEGMYYGIIGALLGGGIAIGILSYTTPMLMEFLKGIPVFPIPTMFFAGLLGAEIGLGIILGIISSWLAVNRYIK